MSIHTFGDSHSCNGWDERVIKHHLGSLLCYSFGRDKLNKCDIRNFNIKDGDTIIFCLGEIDCRCHVHKYITELLTYKNIIDNIVNNYFDAIKFIVNESHINLKNICVYNVVPPVNKNDRYNHPEYPFLGTDEERKQYVLYFNKKLKEKCLENNYIFFDIYDNYIDSNGFLRKDLSDNITHIIESKYITNFIDKYLL